MKTRGLLKVISWVIMAIFLAIAFLTALSAFETPLSTKIFVVESGSMSPALQPGSLIVVKPESDYREGDIITFKKEPEANIKTRGATTTHRIVRKEDELFITKGDANETEDSHPVSQELIIGKLFLAFPYLGYPIAFAKTQTGLIFLVVIPATLIIYSEILNIKKELKKVLARRKKKKEND